MHEHFIDLRKIIAVEQEKGTNPLELWTITKFGFEVIRNGISHWDVRDLKDILEDPKARTNLLSEIKGNKEVAHITQPRAIVSQPPVATQKSEEEISPDATKPLHLLSQKLYRLLLKIDSPSKYS